MNDSKLSTFKIRGLILLIDDNSGTKSIIKLNF